MEIDKVYEPQRFEPHWARWWIDSGIFAADRDSQAPMFSLVIPPPNVTGSLHMGHMLEHTEIDVTVRWHRMRGDNTLWLPGTDHAGIATQMVVERSMAGKGIDRRMAGREEFLKHAWEWKDLYGDRIKSQMNRLGASCDWSRERFTLDPGLSRAVREAFVRLYEKGLIYRGEYMVNWCPRCNTALSDLEVVHEETQGHMWHIRYPVIGSDRYLTVATTRPETMLGDSAVAINPSDTRYTELHVKSVRLPLMDREIPIILDELADPKFGTGVVKVTPAHDPNDFEAGKRHNLPRIKVIDEFALMTTAAGRFHGLDRLEARKRVVIELEQLGLLEKTEPHQLNVGKCQRCRTVVEPLISTQWFASMKPLAAPAIEAVKDGRIQFVPENWSKTYFEWMNNIRDWCVSRQLWWGHRIPAWHCRKCGQITVAREDPESCAHCRSANIEQDPDVLDTWFSSGLWPFSTLGWPDQTKDLTTFYPTTLLITGFDILFFWVARMVMMGMEFTGQVPFRTVYIHGLVRDAERQKMSKTRGNTIDPLVVTEKYGTDAIRFALLRGAAPGSDIVISEERMETARNFANKIWNSARLLFMNLERAGAGTPPVELPLEDRWILSRLNHCAADANRAIENYRYHELADLLYHFVYDEFCGLYLELKKTKFQSAEGASHVATALQVFETMMRLLHPAVPFITEELWQRLEVPGRPISIAIAAYPRSDPAAFDPEAERDVGLLEKIILESRQTRGDNKLDPAHRMDVALYGSAQVANLVESQRDVLENLANIRLEIRRDKPADLPAMPEDFVLRYTIPVNRERISKEIQQLEKVIASSQRQLADDTFTSRAPAKVVEAIRAKLADYEAQLAKSRSALNGV